MIREIPAGREGMVKGNAIRLVRLFKITPVNGIVLRLAAHPHTLEFEGRPYTAAAAIEGTAQVGTTGLEEYNAEMRGALNESLYMTAQLLNNGHFRGAKVTEYVVDWRCPWLGAIETYGYFISKIRHNHSRFSVSVEGLETKMRAKRGGTMARTCPVNVGTQNCGVIRGDITDVGLVVAVVIDERTFEVTGVPPARNGNDYLWGRVYWGAGQNRGYEGTCVGFALAGFTFTLGEPPPFAIVVGDVLNAELGCDGLYSTCGTKFNNAHNFQGQRFARGSSGINKTPVS